MRPRRTATFRLRTAMRPGAPRRSARAPRCAPAHGDVPLAHRDAPRHTATFRSRTAMRPRAPRRSARAPRCAPAHGDVPLAHRDAPRRTATFRSRTAMRPGAPGLSARAPRRPPAHRDFPLAHRGACPRTAAFGVGTEVFRLRTAVFGALSLAFRSVTAAPPLSIARQPGRRAASPTQTSPCRAARGCPSPRRGPMLRMASSCGGRAGERDTELFLPPRSLSLARHPGREPRSEATGRARERDSHAQRGRVRSALTAPAASAPPSRARTGAARSDGALSLAFRSVTAAPPLSIARQPGRRAASPTQTSPCTLLGAW